MATALVEIPATKLDSTAAEFLVRHLCALHSLPFEQPPAGTHVLAVGGSLAISRITVLEETDPTAAPLHPAALAVEDEDWRLRSAIDLLNRSGHDEPEVDCVRRALALLVEEKSEREEAPLPVDRGECLIKFMAQACHYAQDHIDDPRAWEKHERPHLLQCTGHMIACFLAQNTVDGGEGVDSNIIDKELEAHPMKTELEWERIMRKLIGDLGGLKN